MPSVSVVPTSLKGKAAEIATPLPCWPPTSTPEPADGTQIAIDALSQLLACLAKLGAYIASGEVEAQRLSEAFVTSATAYEQADEAASTALSKVGAGAAPGIGGVDYVPPAPITTPSLPVPGGLPTGTHPSPSFMPVEQAAALLESSDQGSSLDAFEAACRSFAADLEARAATFTGAGIPWEGQAAENAFSALDKHGRWLVEMAGAVGKLGDEARQIADAHRAAVASHPSSQDVRTVVDNLARTNYSSPEWVAAYNDMQTRSQEVLLEYVNAATVRCMQLLDPPIVQPNEPATTTTSPGDEPKSPADEKRESQPEQPSPETAPTQPASAESGQAGGGSGGGQSAGGSPSGSGGSGSGGGLPTGGLPTGAGTPEPPALPELDEPTLEPAAAGGGAGGGSGGGGGGGVPMGPALGGVAVSPSPAAGGGGTAAAPAAAGAGGAMGGMGGGMAPMHGAGQQGGKDKRRTPGLSPDEDLYTEDRPWTDPVIGVQRRKIGQDKESK